MNNRHWRYLQLALLAIIGSLFQSPTTASDLKDLACKAAPDAYYHPKAIRLHESGSVLVEYSVSKKGLTKRIVVLQSTASESLNESAILYVTNMRCNPSEEWIKSGGPKKRLRLNVLFQFTNEEPSTPIDPAADWVRFTTPAI